MSAAHTSQGSAPQRPVTVCLYRVQPDGVEAFQRLLEAHWPALRQLNLVTDQPGTAYRGADHTGRPVFVEIFQWADADAAGRAHELSDVSTVWDQMADLCEERHGLAAMEFLDLQRVVGPEA